jgi:hypothetical protein
MRTVDADLPSLVGVGKSPLPAGWVPPWTSAWQPLRSRLWLPAEATESMKTEQVDVVAVAALTTGPMWRRAAGRARAEVTSRRHGLPVGWVWSVKRDPSLRRALQQADVVVSLDRDTDRLTRAVPELFDDLDLVLSDGRRPSGGPPVWDTVIAWQDAVARCEAVLHPPVESDALRRVGTEVGAAISDLETWLVPEALLPAARTLELALESTYWAPGDAGSVVVNLVSRRLLAGGSPRHAGSLSALSLIERLRQGRGEITDQVLGDAAAEALRAADAGASRPRDLALARAHLLAGMGLIHHRARHTQVPHSTLASHPDVVLRPLRACRTWQELRGPTGTRPGVRGTTTSTAHGVSGMRPSVVVLPGPYGVFHADVTDALEPVAARVEVSSLRELRFELRRRRPLPRDLEVLAALREGRVDLRQGTVDGQRPDDARMLRHLRSLDLLVEEMRGHDVVFADWADVSSMWASHLAPRGVRLVLRLHGVDLFDPWLQLMDWRGVDAVVVASPGLAGLFSDLTAGSGAPQPRVAVPCLPHLDAFRLPKTADAHLTLGMVGWGRPVKDPAFALDLLERDPRRRLVLIGPGFQASANVEVQRYAAEVMARIDGPHLRGRVTVVGQTDAVARHLREVGIILSCSWREGLHLGLVEGVASGAVPVVREWPLLADRRAASALYPRSWVVPDLHTADRRIAELSDPTLWAATADRAAAELRAQFEPQAAAARYRSIVLG